MAKEPKDRIQASLNQGLKDKVSDLYDCGFNDNQIVQTGIELLWEREMNKKKSGDDCV